MISSILYYFLIFFIYSVLGWIIESAYVSINGKKIVNRGFLIGPYCPIYGIGSLIIILYLNQYRDNFITVFILCIAVCTILEYFTSYIMEKIFKARWWDYSDRKFNLNGRVCGENAILFGLGGLVIVYLVHPIVNVLLKNIDKSILTIIAIVFLIIFIIDVILSFNMVKKLKDSLGEMNIRKDSTQELKNLMFDTINNNINSKKFSLNLLQKRIIKAFPNFDIVKFINSNKKGIKRFIRKNIYK